MTENTEYIIIIVSFLVVAAFLGAFIIFLMAQQKVLQLIEPQHREMRQGQVWLQLIPIYGWVWQFIVVTKIASSIRAQLLAEDSDTIIGSAANPSERPTYKSGVGYCILTIVSTCISLIPVLSILSLLASVAMIIFWIIYWVELEKYSRILKIRLAGGIAA